MGRQCKSLVWLLWILSMMSACGGQAGSASPSSGKPPEIVIDLSESRTLVNVPGAAAGLDRQKIEIHNDASVRLILPEAIEIRLDHPLDMRIVSVNGQIEKLFVRTDHMSRADAITLCTDIVAQASLERPDFDTWEANLQRNAGRSSINAFRDLYDPLLALNAEIRPAVVLGQQDRWFIEVSAYWIPPRHQQRYLDSREVKERSIERLRREGEKN